VKEIIYKKEKYCCFLANVIRLIDLPFARIENLCIVIDTNQIAQPRDNSRFANKCPKIIVLMGLA